MSAPLSPTSPDTHLSFPMVMAEYAFAIAKTTGYWDIGITPLNAIEFEYFLARLAEHQATSSKPIDTLVLSLCSLAGYQIKRIAWYLESDPCITHLDISRNTYDLDDLRQFFGIIVDNKTLKSLRIGSLTLHNPRLEQVVGAYIEQNPLISELALGCQDTWSDLVSISEGLASNTHLSKLTLWGTGISIKGVTQFTEAFDDDASVVGVRGAVKNEGFFLSSVTLEVVRAHQRSLAVILRTEIPEPDQRKFWRPRDAKPQINEAVKHLTKKPKTQ